MQKAKDSFLNFLSSRIAELDDERTVTIDGAVRPAVMACENERAELAQAFENSYCVDWGDAVGGRDEHSFQTVNCTISYWTCGAAEMSGVDRGRKLAEMDRLLRLILAPGRTPKVDLTANASIKLGSMVFWGEPKFAAPEQDGMKLKREVAVAVHYFPEEEL